MLKEDFLKDIMKIKEKRRVNDVYI